MGRWRSFSDGFLFSQWNRKQVIHCEGKWMVEVRDRRRNGPCKCIGASRKPGATEVLAVQGNGDAIWDCCPFLPPIRLSYARAGVELVSWKDGRDSPSDSTWGWDSSSEEWYLWQLDLGEWHRRATEGELRVQAQKRAQGQRVQGLDELSAWEVPRIKLEPWEEEWKPGLSTVSMNNGAERTGAKNRHRCSQGAYSALYPVVKHHNA